MVHGHPVFRAALRWRGSRAQRRLAPFGSIRGDEAARAAYHEALANIGLDVDPEVVDNIEELNLGRRKRGRTAKAISLRRTHACSAAPIGIILEPGDPLPHLNPNIPEVAIVGRSNVGKSSLLNALLGDRAWDGVASVSARPGWTANIQFFELSEQPGEPLMTLVDLPGYGPAPAAAAATRRRWERATRAYLQVRPRLACAFLLLDASLGVTPDDDVFFDLLDERRLPYHVILTKGDLLTPLELAQSYELVRRHVVPRPSYAGGDMPMCSAATAAGIASLWERLRGGVLQQREMWDEDDVKTLEAEAERGGQADQVQRATTTMPERTLEKSENGETPGDTRRRRQRRRVSSTRRTAGRAAT